MSLDLYGAPTNNAGIDPIQGFDFECWAQDTVSGRIAFFGRFQSLTVSVRDATETYLELGQRIPIYLNGEIQIAWVLEQGLVDMAFILRTFGIQDVRRDQVIARGPRFHIAFDANAADRVSQETTNSINRTNNSGSRLGNPNPLFGGASFETGTLSGIGGNTIDLSKAQSAGRYEMMRCKVDSVSLGVMPGRRVAAVRWEGVSEGITYVNESLQTFKSGQGVDNQLGSRSRSNLDFDKLTTQSSGSTQS